MTRIRSNTLQCIVFFRPTPVAAPEEAAPAAAPVEPDDGSRLPDFDELQRDFANFNLPSAEQVALPTFDDFRAKEAAAKDEAAAVVSRWQSISHALISMGRRDKHQRANNLGSKSLRGSGNFF